MRTLEERLRQTIDRLFRLLGLRYSMSEMRAVYRAFSGVRGTDLSAAVELLDNVLHPDLKRVVVPMLDMDRPHERGRDLFGVESMDTESALRELLLSGDRWLAVCAMAAAAELQLRGLKADIGNVARAADEEVAEVARAAAAALL